MLLSPPNVPWAGDTSLARIQSQPLRFRFSWAWRTMSCVSAAKPMTRPGRRLAGLGHGREDVGVLGEPQGGRRSVLLDLLRRGVGDAPVGDGSGEDRDIDRQRGLARRQHVPRALDPDEPDAGRVGLVAWPGDENRLGAERGERGGDGVALLARGAVGDVAHGVDRLMGRPARHQRAPALELARSGEEALDRGDDLERFGDAAHAGLAVGERAGIGSDPTDAAGFEQREIGLGRRVVPHHDVHRRRDEHRLVGREQRRAREIVGKARRHAGEKVRRGRRDDDEVGSRATA